MERLCDGGKVGSDLKRDDAVQSADGFQYDMKERVCGGLPNE